MRGRSMMLLAALTAAAAAAAAERPHPAAADGGGAGGGADIDDDFVAELMRRIGEARDAVDPDGRVGEKADEALRTLHAWYEGARESDAGRAVRAGAQVVAESDGAQRVRELVSDLAASEALGPVVQALARAKAGAPAAAAEVRRSAERVRRGASLRSAAPPDDPAFAAAAATGAAILAAPGCAGAVLHAVPLVVGGAAAWGRAADAEAAANSALRHPAVAAATAGWVDGRNVTVDLRRPVHRAAFAAVSGLVALFVVERGAALAAGLLLIAVAQGLPLPIGRTGRGLTAVVIGAPLCFIAWTAERCGRVAGTWLRWLLIPLAGAALVVAGLNHWTDDACAYSAAVPPVRCEPAAWAALCVLWAGGVLRHLRAANAGGGGRDGRRGRSVGVARRSPRSDDDYAKE